MPQRIFIQYQTSHIPGEPVRKTVAVATAACMKLLGREFTFKTDFLHAQGEVLQEQARCHVLVDCDFQAHNEPDLKRVDLVCYRVVVEGGGLALSFSLVETNVHRGQIDVVPWGRHSFSRAQ